MTKIKVGVQAMMLREQFLASGPYETLKKVNDIGFHSVEISQIPMTPENVAEMCRASVDFGIDISAISASVAPMGPRESETLTTHFDKIVSDCKALNCSFIRIGMLPFDCMGNIASVLNFCQMANTAALRLKEHGISLYYHNHHIEFQKFDGKYMLDIIRENATELGFELDVHWIQRGGCDPLKVIADYAGKVDLIHLKDYRIGTIAPEGIGALSKGDFKTFMQSFSDVVQFAEIGEGNLDMPAIIEASMQAGAKYFFIEQDNLYGRDVFDCLKTSYDNLTAMGYEII